MSTEAGAFAEQARHDLACFCRLWLMAASAPAPPAPPGTAVAWRVHAGHYLQMSTEKAAKAALLSLGATPSGRALGHSPWATLTAPAMRAWAEREIGLCVPRRVRDSLRDVEQCCPNNAGNGPNFEYPWPAAGRPGGWTPPCAHGFPELASEREVTTAANCLRAVLQTILPRP